MKCDELKQVENPIEWGSYYNKSEVDNAIEELKSEADKVIADKDQEIVKLKEQVALLQAEFIQQPGV